MQASTHEVTMRSILARSLRCPACGASVDPATLTCNGCATTYPVLEGVPALLPNGELLTALHPAPGGSATARWANRLLRPPEFRVWSQASKEAIRRALSDVHADDPAHLVINVGAGIEKVFHDAFAGQGAVARVGLPHTGRVELFGDITSFPLADGSVDLLLSSSVLEHVRDPEQGVAEMGRVVRSGGLVYAEIPFLRGYHMAPHDYQRYTIAGIEQLFARHGFELVDKGVCSGPFTALALFILDTAKGFARGGPRWARKLMRVLAWIVHPIKYLDRLVEGHEAAESTACNFYYLGRRASA